MTTPRLILAAPESGSGKTIITAGLCYALKQRGFTVQTFKTGPDYIDPSYHKLASGRPCRNLDAWMLSKTAVKDAFQRNSRQADIAIIEGVMGLFDGFGVEDNSGSTAEIAQLLDAPVVLILPVRGQARSAAATVLGFNSFSPNLKLAGVILNRVGSSRHAEMCQTAIEKETAVSVLGYIPRSDAFILPERHLGLIPTAEEGNWLSVIEKIGAQVEETVDVDALLKVSGVRRQVSGEAQYDDTSPHHPITPSPHHPISLAVAEDAAFTFTYPENLELLAEAGAKILPFSPIADKQLPENIDGIILSGGFPELYAEQISQNTRMHEAIRAAAENNLPIYAECGGLMYLTQSITDQAGRQWPMVGVLPGHSQMTQRVTLGYRLVEAVADGPILKQGEQVRGHEFHYSSWELPGETAVSPAYTLLNPRNPNEVGKRAGVRLGSVWASYIHIHFLSKSGIAERFVQYCREHQYERA